MIYRGDLFDVLPTLAAESIDACVTDPPYGIGFMSKKWDTFKAGAQPPRTAKTSKDENNPNLKGRTMGMSSPSAIEYDRGIAGQREFQAWTERWAREVYRVLKPGAHVLVCGAPRSFHRMTSGLEDAGFVVRDCFSWLYGQGFPKSLNLGDGRGTALKPSWEPIILARKPLIDTLEVNAAMFGTGALNIDACRIECNDELSTPKSDPAKRKGVVGQAWQATGDAVKNNAAQAASITRTMELGRWPTNVILDPEAAALLDARFGDLFAESSPSEKGASRFFYTAKPSRSERDEGCYDLKAKSGGEATDREDGSAGTNSPRAGAGRTGGSRNFHPTVKPVDLMVWLVNLVTPPNGIVLDPFMGSGTTGMAARHAERQFIGVEREAEYVEIARRRISETNALFSGEEEVIS